MENMVGLMILAQILIFTHLLMVYVQVISGKNYFYGVYVKNVNLNEDDKKRIDKEYKRRMNYTLILIIILSILLIKTFGRETIIIPIALTIYIGLSYWYLRDSYIEVKNIKSQLISFTNGESIQKQSNQTITIDTKFINEKEKLKRKFKILFGICVAISIISFVYVAINYNNLPETIPIHWGIDGKPDAYAPKNLKNVFFINILDIGMVLMLSYMGVGTIGYRSYIDTQNKEENRKKALKYLNNIGYSLFTITISMQLATSINPMLTVNNMNIPMQLVFITMFIPIIGGIFLTYSFIMLSTLKSKNKNTYMIESDDEKWIYGFIYYNKEDPSFMVEKRIGAGWTFNMAHKSAKIIIIFLILILIFSLTAF
ncbi:DUF1648 domain-containing protein [Paraclostridium sordellii]|uniref:DUF1648 domain-containing protein n=1 Tax=Paraclostridium sordellii TaxID=1505 RepID=UPI0005E81B62|nr:DUF1648 domain-containing protein [Paeniclostridium sordellii]CEQ16759.1 membrane protein [[Clostridium] sordellii] [Paeniclostridium sordellii]